jgi:hypothetical protein
MRWAERPEVVIFLIGHDARMLRRHPEKYKQAADLEQTAVLTGGAFVRRRSINFKGGPTDGKALGSHVYFAKRRTLKEIGSPTTTMCTASPRIRS